MNRLHKDIVLRREFDGSGILLNTRTGAVFMLNRTAVCICEALTNGLADEEILACLGEKTNLPPDAADHLQKFLTQLRAKNYLAD